VILQMYFARRFAGTFLAVLALFFAMLTLIELIEQARRFSDQTTGMGQIAALTLLSVPQTLYGILPLITIIATLALFVGLSRSSELIVTRAAGRSALRALMAPVGVALLAGGLAVAFLNPIVAATSREYAARVDALGSGGSALALSGQGLWLREGDALGQTVIRAETANLDGTELRQASFITFGPDGQPTRRIEAALALLRDGAWHLTDAKVWPLSGSANPERDATLHPGLTLPSSLTADEIRDSFGAPEAIAIWDLPGFIARMQAAGFTARRHQVYLQMELAMPAVLVAMVLIGAGFTMRHQRGGRTGLMVLVAILVGFGIYFLRNFAQVLGEAGEIPPVMAAWTPPLAAIGLSLGLLLHLEDG